MQRLKYYIKSFQILLWDSDKYFPNISELERSLQYEELKSHLFSSLQIAHRTSSIMPLSQSVSYFFQRMKKLFLIYILNDRGVEIENLKERLEPELNKVNLLEFCLVYKAKLNPSQFSNKKFNEILKKPKESFKFYILEIDILMRR